MKKRIIFLLSIILLVQCTKVPLTGRKQLSIIPNSELLPMSFTQYNEITKEGDVIHNSEWAGMVKNVGNRIKIAAETYMKQNGISDQLTGYNWEFKLLKGDSVVNAWCLPGGKVAFYTGIMPICKDEKGVAVVMGHEVAHAIANHGRERMSQGLVANGLVGGVAAALGENRSLTEEILLQSAGIGSQLGMLSYSRLHESEADKIGLIFMAIAGYNPNEAPAFWKRMAENKKTGTEIPEFLSTHPSTSERIKDLEKAIPEAMKYYKDEK